MKCLFFPLYINTPHFETDLEIIATHLRKKDEIYVIKCNGRLSACLQGINHTKSSCILCRSVIAEGLKWLPISQKNIITLPHHKEPIKIPANFSSLSELIKFHYNGLELGRASASNLLFQLNWDHKLNTIIYQSQVYRQLKSIVYLSEAMLTVLRSIKPDRVYIFNGRFSEPAAIMQVCKKLGISCYTQERAGIQKKYLLRLNSTPLDISSNTEEINRLWNQKINGEKEKEAEKWFLQRRFGEDQAFYSFVKKQKLGKLPDNFDKTKKNVVIFNSTIEEFFTQPGWENPLYEDDDDGLQKIADSLKNDGNVHTYLRVHPRLKGVNNTQTRDIERLKNRYENFTVIPPESPISSYTLMDNCDIIITFGSTIGVEACFWGKPSILAGHAIYEDLDCVYKPKTHKELVELIKSDIQPKDKTDAFKYAYWQTTYGVLYKYYKPIAVSKGLFLGKTIHPSLVAIIKFNFMRFFDIKNIDELKTTIRNIARGLLNKIKTRI